jgi:EAL domain-containing protein (putative c-di-GMP-specific phosphodiesterase class I)
MHHRRPPRHSAAVLTRRMTSLFGPALFGSIEMVLQPIVSVSSGALVAAEALARFPGNPDTPVDETFAVAYAAGRGPELEAACLRAAMRKRFEALDSDIAITVNVSPDALQHPSVRSALRCDLSGVVIEITEHATGDLVALQRSLDDLRSRGAQIAIDDASTGYAGLLRLTALRPDLVKLDRGLVAGARDSVEQSAVIEALVSLSRRIGAQVLGEGVETLDDLTALAELDVDLAQGYYIGEPTASLSRDLPEVAMACRAARSQVMRNEPANSPESAANGLRTATAALAASVQPADLEVALNAARLDLGIDVISLSTLSQDGMLSEISCAGGEIDHVLYPVTDYPTTKAALDNGVMTEAHLEDPLADPAELQVMEADGIFSLLVMPVIGQGQSLGILEFRNRSHRRWNSQDMAQARILAEHIGSVLLRMPNSQPGTGFPRRRQSVAVAS